MARPRRIRQPSWAASWSAGRLGGARRGIAVGAQALDRGARQIVGIAPFLRRSRSSGFDRGGRRSAAATGAAGEIHGLHGRRQYHPDLFLFARRRCMAPLVGVGRAFGRFRIGLGIEGLGRRVWHQPCVGLCLGLCFSLALGLFDHRRPFGSGLLHDGFFGDSLRLDAGGREIADAGRGLGRPWRRIWLPPCHPPWDWPSMPQRQARPRWAWLTM